MFQIGFFNYRVGGSIARLEVTPRGACQKIRHHVAHPVPGGFGPRPGHLRASYHPGHASEHLKSRGAPVEWHVYERATHAFDKDNTSRGYQRNGEVTADAMKQTLAFLDRWR